MTPKPQEYKQTLQKDAVTTRLNGESVVISGMSGLFPRSRNIRELGLILYNKSNPVTSDECRWDYKHPESSKYMGKVADLDRFDAQFFMVHYRLGDCMDPMAKKILEQSYQAIYDAGLCPAQLNGKKVGVYIAAAHSDTESAGFFSDSNKTGFGITGVSKTMYANRISYWLNSKGPSMNFDDACCGSCDALYQAFSAINSGLCEAAIVGGTNTCLLPHAQVHYNRCIKIAPDGKTKSFDENADGCAKSDAISVLFLQKAKNALRAYAELIHVKSEFISRLSGETGQRFGFIRDPYTTAAFLKQFYEEANVPPQAVEYVEAFGSATAAADKAELQCIEKIFCENRSDPLLVGSVISNIGFTETVSGLTAITKVLLGYHCGKIANTLHCKTPRRDIAAIRDGSIKIVTENTSFNRTYTAVNNLSVSGVNAHVLLHGYMKAKDYSRYKSSIPRLVTLSARQEGYLEHIFDDMSTRLIDPEEHALLHNIHSTNIAGHLGRGYIILDTDEDNMTQYLSRKKQHSDEVKRPLWFVYSGMGSQWAGMGAQLMRIPIFAAAIERCHKVLEPKGIDLMHIITSPDKTIFDNVLNSFVGIGAIQIGLTDILRELGLNPDYVIGHSVGELGCAYADGCLTAEEMILAAYSRGMASHSVPLIRGAMAAVGLGFQVLSKICPPEIDIACHNSSGSSTISGPVDCVREFVASLSAKGIFAKEVPSSNIAYHSRYIADAAPELLRLLEEVIKENRPRTERWLSTSMPEKKWNEPLAKYCSPEYMTNNLLSSVLFEETCKHIPSNAVLVEIAPHGLLQAILKRSLPESCVNVPLTQRGHKDNALFLLDAIGTLYMLGYTPKVQALYPKIEFPVSTGTPHLSHFVKWNHNEQWIMKAFDWIDASRASASCKFLITTYDEENKYIKGNVIQGNVLYPFAAALAAVWDTLAMSLGVPKKQISVRFQDVYFYSQPILRDQKILRLSVSVNRGNGWFEVLDTDSKVATGYVYSDATIDQEIGDRHECDISANDVYQQLKRRGYSYRDNFRSIHSVDESLTRAQLVWDGNWVTLIDGMLQLNALKCAYEGVSQPIQIREIIIDVNTHQELSSEKLLSVELDHIVDCTRCGGVILHNIKFRNLSTDSVEKVKFKLFAPPLPCERKNDNKNVEHPVKFGSNNLVGEHVALQISISGEVDALHWIEAPKLAENGIKVVVEYAGINMSDVKRAAGVIPLDDGKKYYGADFSGVTESGNRVMGLVRNGAVSTIVSSEPELLWPVPEHWSLEDAATVPFAYAQAFYCLCIKNYLKPGSRVLIHGGAGALGQAAISIALANGCEVFTTVANNSKKLFLRKLFPQLKAEAIGNSRDASFGDLVLSATNGEGCNIVLSCVRQKLKNTSLKCSAFSGITVDTEQMQRRDKFEYGMYNMTKQRSYMAIDMDCIFDKENGEEIRRKLQVLMSEGIARGYVRPLSRVTFAPQEAPRAFRLLAASRHFGRVLLRLCDSLPPAQPRVVCSPALSQLIIWDGSLYGIQLAEKLLSCGANKLRIQCLNPASDLRLQSRLWRKMGVDVEIHSEKLTDYKNISALLKHTSQSGPIEGIFVTAASVEGRKRFNELSTIVTHLDAASRVSCPLLKYFAVITIDSNFGQQICLSRFKDGLPATVLSLPDLKKTNNGGDTLMDEASWIRCAVDAAELAVRCKQPVLIADPQTIKKPSLLQQIAKISGLNILDGSNDDSTLRDMGIEHEQANIIQSYVKDLYNISFEEEDILTLTKKKIQQLEKDVTNHSFAEVKGLNTFFSYVDSDELNATTELMPLNTLVHNVKTAKQWYDQNKTHLFILPGLEGHHARFTTLCERLKLPAFVLQPGLEHPHETPQELALRYSKVLLNTLELKNNFYLLGYEYGIIVALELAAILESKGLTGTVFCLGEGPEEIKALIESELRELPSDEELQTAVAKHMFMLMTGDVASAAAASALLDCSSWKQRVEACVRSVLERVSHSTQYTFALIDAAYSRLMTARRYGASRRVLRSRLVLLRTGAAAAAPCSLQQYSQQPLVVHELAAPLAHATLDLQCSAIVNNYLEATTLEAFENSNLCETYLYQSIH